MKNATNEQKELIKKIKKECQKAANKVIAMTFDQNIRNARFLEIMTLQENKIAEVLRTAQN
jgi:hypothetical protein